MKPLTPNFLRDYKGFEGKLADIPTSSDDAGFNQEEVLHSLNGLGYAVSHLHPRENPPHVTILSGDSSIVVKELRFQCLWGIHCVCLYATFDGLEHTEPLSCQGSIGYRDILFDSLLDAGFYLPYQDVDLRAKLTRIFFETYFLLKSLNRVEEGGGKVDHIVVDGSLLALKRNTESLKYPESAKASQVFKTLTSRRVVGLVEDSTASDISQQLGLGMTNLNLFDLILAPSEYTVCEKNGVYACYIKLPEKTLSHTPSRVSAPLTVRWEFNYPDFIDDLEVLAGVWLREDDLLHPQIYPVRVADYLTRRIKVGGVLDDLAEKHNLPQKFRELRQG